MIPRARSTRLAAIIAAGWVVAALGFAAVAETPPDVFEDLRGNGELGEFTVVDAQLSEKSGGEVSYAIAFTRWNPERPNGTTIVYNHGLQSHRGWYNATATWLAERGYTVYAFDRIGSGTSADGLAFKDKALIEARGHVHSWELFLDTIDGILGLVHEQRPDDTVFLWSNSYGAKVVTAWLLDNADDLAARNVAGAIYTSPGLYLNKKTMPLPFSKAKLASSGGLRPFPVPMVAADDDNGAHWFVDPGIWFDRIAADGLSLREVTRTFYMQTRKMDGLIDSHDKGRRIPVPTFYALVRNDVMMDNDKVERHVGERASDGTVKYYSGGPDHKHFLLFTEDRDAVLADVVAFLENTSIDGAQHYWETNGR